MPISMAEAHKEVPMMLHQAMRTVQTVEEDTGVAGGDTTVDTDEDIKVAIT